MAAKLAVAVGATKWLFAALLISFCGYAQNVDSTQNSNPISLEILYGYYQQDGNHSAVTGGTGTEELSYNAPTIVVHIPTDSASQMTIKAGVDIYSSASQDAIDFNVSSASRKDARTHLQVSFSTTKQQVQHGINGSFSIESDYMSLGIGGFYAKSFKNYSRTFSVSGQFYADDARWGRLSEDDTLALIYPEELRDSTWETKSHRYSTSVSFAYTAMVNRRINVGIFADAVWQSGLLSTTFHRVYFDSENRAVVENLPDNRLKFPVGMRLNYFAHRNFLLRFYYRFYLDSWSHSAHTFEIEPVWKASATLSLYPFYRFYWQHGIEWFAPFDSHTRPAEFYTSDYDLSSFSAHKYGLGLRWMPANGFLRWRGKHNFYGWQGLQIRTGVYHRTDGLNALFLSTALQFGKQ